MHLTRRAGGPTTDTPDDAAHRTPRALDPGGATPTAAFGPGGDPPTPSALDDFRAAGVLDALDVAFARAMGRLAGCDDALALLAAAFASRAPRLGHVCAELRTLPSSIRTEGAASALPWPDPGAWTAAIGASALVADGAPLVLDGDRLYLARYWGWQQRLVSALRARAGDPVAPPPAGLPAALARLFPTESADAQALAVATAALRPLAVISGGPGTGKTTTVVRLLALLLDPDLGLGGRRVALAAPTGKAAARLVEAIRDKKPDLVALGVSAATLEALPTEASTLHRLLGWRPDRPTSFRHDASNPLPVDVVVVDEASMVDLALMAKLVDAIPRGARLVLLGDRDQLASVEAGAVLGDLCDADGPPRGRASALSATLHAVLGPRCPPHDVEARPPAIADCIVPLTRTWRFDARSGIGALAAAINAGDAPEALRVLEGDASDDVTLHGQPDLEARLRALRALVVEAYAPALRERDPAAALAALGRFRVLCAHRRGPSGVEALNVEIERWLAAAGLLERDGDWYPGRPLLVTRNDPTLGLFNGDLGVVLPAPAGLRAWFPDRAGRGAPGGARAFLPGRLPPHDTVFALTVHQSQGSEFDHVAVVLPPDPSPVLTRELLYTALTRARRRADLFGPPAVVQHAIGERVRRASGLRDALYAPPSGP